MAEPLQVKPGRWLVIPLEVQVRELHARLLVGAIAADRGYDVLIGHDRVVRRLARHLPRGILFDKALGAATDRKVRRYARLGYRLTALDEESTGIYPNPDMFFSTRLSPQALVLAERWFAISDRVRDLAARRFPGQAIKIVTTGLPRADVWRRPFHGLYRAESERIRAAHGDFILFNSNFGTIVHARRGEFVERQAQRHRRRYAGAAAYQRQREAQGLANLDAFLEMLPRLREWFPDTKVIVRPHPSEDHAFWRESLAGIDGIEVHAGGIATPWILASRALVHHGCTTGIEAGLMDQPHVMYAPHPDDH
ncbi:MAG: surface carbohydrate biosynthesis protein, partial [Pseudomonadota bacterium]|nr:surface carbohydrate biosynthesis protein [Pseudomonadota bacterium]